MATMLLASKRPLTSPALSWECLRWWCIAAAPRAAPAASLRRKHYGTTFVVGES